MLLIGSFKEKESDPVSIFCEEKSKYNNYYTMMQKSKYIPLSESHDQVDTCNLLWTALSPFFVLIQCAILLYCIFVTYYSSKRRKQECSTVKTSS